MCCFTGRFLAEHSLPFLIPTDPPDPTTFRDKHGPQARTGYGRVLYPRFPSHLLLFWSRTVCKNRCPHATAARVGRTLLSALAGTPPVFCIGAYNTVRYTYEPEKLATRHHPVCRDRIYFPK